MENKKPENQNNAVNPAMGEDKAPPQEDKVMQIPEAEYLKLTSEAAVLRDKNLRLYAEFENTRKRMERERLEFVKFANEGLLSEILEVIDDLERTVKVAKEKHQDYDAFLKGVEMVMNKVNELLKRNGVKPIEAKGKMFDPHCHEVLIQEENADSAEGTVLEELQKGFLYNDRVLRTAKVKLAKGKEEEKKD
ncbi:MAG: nucleotide exchange factor GrpE [Candidatus Omnitrophica bacterium]|nr:nucleotide exchange factor GrpE [Candidatus Omnitrophota bacterium]